MPCQGTFQTRINERTNLETTTAQATAAGVPEGLDPALRCGTSDMLWGVCVVSLDTIVAVSARMLFPDRPASWRMPDRSRERADVVGR